MPRAQRMTILLSKIQKDQLARLAAKLQIDQSNVMRLALTRLAEAEGVLQPAKRP